MPLNRAAMATVLANFSRVKGLNCTVKESFKGAVTAGACAFGGGLVGGPIGLAIGGTVGSIFAAYSSRGQFKPVATVLQEELTPMQREQLEIKFLDIFRDIDANDITTALAMIMGSTSLQRLILQQLAVFLKNEMGYQMMS